MGLSSSGVKFKSVMKYAGGYIAWVIGSGFATGQEALQFFSSYGYKSYAVAGINLLGFIVFGYLVMRTGFENKSDAHFDHFRYFCGRKLGIGYSWLVIVTLLMLLPVLVSGGGAALDEYYHIPKPLGSALLAAVVLAVYLIGFEKMVGIVSKLGPLIILLCLSIGLLSLLQGRGSWAAMPDNEAALSPHQAAPTWWLSGFLYLGLNIYPGSTYFARLGTSAHSKKELQWGALVGGVILMLAIIIMSTAIMLNGAAVADLDVPVLYLARNVAPVFGVIFSVVLELGIFSSCSVITWSVNSTLSARTHKNALTAVAVAIFGYGISLLPFGTLISTIYPLIGYAGLLYLACVLWKGLARRRTDP